MGEIRQKKTEWNFWEKRIVNEARIMGHYPVQVPATIRNWSARETFRKKHGYPVKIKSFPDFCLGIKPNQDLPAVMCVFDAKATNERVWNLKEHCFSEKKIHQYAEILASKERGCVGGYLIWFVDYRQVVWAPIGLIEELRLSGVASISPQTVGVNVQDELVVLNFQKLLGFRT